MNDFVGGTRGDIFFGLFPGLLNVSTCGSRKKLCTSFARPHPLQDLARMPSHVLTCFCYLMVLVETNPMKRTLNQPIGS